jgi:hypothetical protein
MSQFIKLQVSFPPGAGGNWLASVLSYCVYPDYSWAAQKINFHNIYKIELGHHPMITDNTLSIGNNSYKYNFWKLYLHKQILRNSKYTRIGGKKFIVNPHKQTINNKDNFFWLIDQCRCIQNYQCPGKFQIDWQDLFVDPNRAWTAICNFLEYNHKKNHIDFPQFKIALDSYTKTCQVVNYKTNVNHRLFLIWSLAFLQNNNYTAPFDVFEKFGSEEMTTWVHKFRPMILEYTQQNTFSI